MRCSTCPRPAITPDEGFSLAQARVLGQAMGSGCPCSVDLQPFLAGAGFPLPYPMGTIAPFGSTAGGGIFGSPANPTPINNLQELLAYLNTVIIQNLINTGHAVQGAFSIVGDKLLVPVVDGSCLIIINGPH